LDPKYREIEKYIEQLILTGKILPGDKLPSENSLAKKFNTTRMTVRKAFDELESIGLITKVQGVGTFVSEINVFAHKRVGLLINNKRIMYGAVNFLSSVGTKMFSLQKGVNEKEEEKALDDLLSKEIDGLIIEPSEYSIRNKLLKELIKSRFPIVFVDRNIPLDDDIPTVMTDNFAGGRLLARHMKKSHRVDSALFVTAEELTISSVEERYKGISKELGYSPHIVRIDRIDGDYSPLVNEVQLRNAKCVFFCNDMLAVRGLFYLVEGGFRIPEDISVTGFDDEYVSSITRPKLTTVKQDLTKIGEVGASVLMSIIKGEKVKSRYLVGVELVVRESCGCPSEE